MRWWCLRLSLEWMEPSSATKREPGRKTIVAKRFVRAGGRSCCIDVASHWSAGSAEKSVVALAAVTKDAAPLTRTTTARLST